MNWLKKLKKFDAPFLAHHPLCSSFKQDLLQIRGWKLCLGCAISYPLAIAVMIASIWYPYGDWEWYKLAIWGIPLGLVQLTSTVGLTKWKSLKILVKIMLGIGIGFTVLAVLKLPFPLPIRTLVLIFCTQLASIPAALRTKNIKKKCEKCPYEARWDCCPGYINTRQNTGILHDLPIMPAGRKSVKFELSNGESVELPVPLE